MIYLIQLLAVAALLSDPIWARSSTLETAELSRSDGSRIQYHLARDPKASSQAILLVMQGSDCNSIAAHPTIMEFAKVAPDHAVLLVEKYGITNELPWLPPDRDDCPEAYLQHNSLEQRIIDYLQVIATLRRAAGWWNRRLVIIGGSAGALTAAPVAALAPEASRLIIFGFGSRYFRTDLLSSIRTSLAGDGLDKAAIEEELEKVEAHFMEMVANPTATQFSSGHSFAYWASMWRYDQLAALSEVEIPVLAVQGSRDQLVSPEGGRLLVEELRSLGKNNITYKEYGGLDHGFRDAEGDLHRRRVIEDMSEWLRLEI